MSRIRPWAPIVASGVFVTATLFVSAHASSPTVMLAPLPGPVHVAEPHVPDLQAETAAPLFAPTRSNAPIGAADAAPPVPPPALSGIVLGGGHAVALIKPASGETAMTHVGETVDGWTVDTIEARRVIFTRGGEKQTVELLFGAAKPKEGQATPPTTVQPGPVRPQP